LTDAPTHFSEYVVNGVTYTSVEALQASLLDVIYTRLSLGTISGTGTVTNVSLSLGSTGTDVNGSVASPTTTPIITLNIPTASATNRGVLSASDWSLFNGKQNAITLTTIGSSGAATLVGSTLNIPNYSTDLTGYVTLDTAQTITGAKTLTSLLTGTRANFTSSGSDNTFAINHSSGSGIGLSITKGGNGEGIYVNKTSGTGNAVTIVGTFNATTIVKNGGTSSQFLKADGSVDSNSYALVSALTGYVPTSRTLTINGTAFDLSANRSWTIPTHDAVTIGTANGLSLSGQALSMALASGSVTGALSSANWTTFNNKQNALNGTGFVKISGTTISYDNSSYALASSLSGYLPLTGGTLTGTLTATNANFISTNSSGTLGVYATASGQGLMINPNNTAGTVNIYSDYLGGSEPKLHLSTYADRVSANGITIVPGGNVGIGTASPKGRLEVADVSQLTNAGQWLSATISMKQVGGFIGDYSQIVFGYHANTQTNGSAYIGYLATNQGANGFGDLVFGTRAVNTDTQPTERMRITSGGNVLIGTTTDNGAKLQVNGAATFSSSVSRSILFNSTNANGPYAGWQKNGSDEFYIGRSDAIGGGSGFYDIYANAAAGGLRFYVSGNVSPSLTLAASTGAATFASSVSIINNANTATKFAFSNQANASGSIGVLASSAGNTNVIYTSDLGGHSFVGGAATFSSSVTSTGFFVSSDITLKTLTKDKFDASKIDAISYKWKTDLQGKTLVGYSAQDVQKYMPDAVNTDSNGKLSVDYIQVLVQKIAHLETELKSLKNGLE
jgi:hypothetical protein